MSIFSGIPIAIGGTDLNPAVFYGDFVVAIAEEWGRDLEPGNGAVCWWYLWVYFLPISLSSPTQITVESKKLMGPRSCKKVLAFGSVVSFQQRARLLKNEYEQI